MNRFSEKRASFSPIPKRVRDSVRRHLEMKVMIQTCVMDRNRYKIIAGD